MGRRRALPLMMSLLLLAGCAGRGGEKTGEERALELQKEYGALTAVTCRVSLSADYGDQVFDCVMDVVWDAASGGTLTLVEPEIARGVAAHFAQGEAALTYDDFSLDLGPLTPDGLAPAEALPTLWRQVTQGYVASARVEDGLLSATYRRGEDPPGTGLEASVLFEAESGVPRSGELLFDGVRVVSVTIEDFQSMGPEETG